MGMNGISGIGGAGAAYGYDRFRDELLVPGAPEEDWEKPPGVEGEEDEEKYEPGRKPGKKSSFKAAGHIDPNNAAMVVMGHEQEHVSNAYRKAELGGGEVERASVRLKTAICPVCGRTYISGGETTTQIRYYNERNPYQKDMKESDAVNKYRGANVDMDQ